jgi:hypothetical protein
MKLILTQSQFMTDISDSIHSIRLQIPQHFVSLNMCLSLGGGGKKKNLFSPAVPGIETSSF